MKFIIDSKMANRYNNSRKWLEESQVLFLYFSIDFFSVFFVIIPISV